MNVGDIRKYRILVNKKIYREITVELVEKNDRVHTFESLKEPNKKIRIVNSCLGGHSWRPDLDTEMEIELEKIT